MRIKFHHNSFCFHQLPRHSFFRQSAIVFLITMVFTSCSVYSTRFYSKPESGALKNAPIIGSSFNTYGYYRFSSMGLPEVFRDSQPGMLLKIWIENAYEKARFGPPFIPILASRNGYGYSPDHLNKKDTTQYRQITLHLEITNFRKEALTFDPFALYMISRKTGVRSFPVLLDSSSVSSNLTTCTEKCSWKIVFSPGMQVDDQPVIYLPGFMLEKKPLYLEGIPFKKGKKVFYAVIIPVNG